MAGAVSAGAYTAGVMDYILETLSKWEKAKEKNKKVLEEYGAGHPDYDASIPMHDVIIEVIGGASAGGMTSAIASLSLFEGIRPINPENEERKDNKLYDCWVNLNDEQGTPTLEQMLENDDIFDDDGVSSILNSKPVEQIAMRALNLDRISMLPDYISKNLEVILTITSLRGIPLAINFFDQDKDEPVESREDILAHAAHRMNLHKGIAHFRVMDRVEAVPDHIIPFNPRNEQDRQLLVNCAIATGAFPIGLKPRYLEGTKNHYIKSMAQRMFQPPYSGDYDMSGWQNSINIVAKEEDDVFNFIAVDGGAVNNEPFGEVIRALEEKCQHDGSDYAVIMIDPFPNFETEEATEPNSNPKLAELIPAFFGAVRSQALMKESDLVRGLSSDYTRRMVFPSRKKDDDPDTKDPYPISCGSLDGFGGFFSKDFREHDFFLGRKNAQSFLRNYFCIPKGKAQHVEAFSDWTEDDPRYKRFYSAAVNGYPIIPDLSYDPEQYGDNALKVPERRRIPDKALFNLEKPLKKRLTEVLININKFDTPEPTKEQRKLEKEVEKILRKHYKTSTAKQLRSDLLGYFFQLLWKYYGASQVAGILTKQALKYIITDFKKRGLLEEGES